MTEVTEAEFQREVVERSQSMPVVVDFWAPWCGRCRAFAPVLEAAVAARRERLALAKIDADANPRLAAHLGVHGIPAIKVFRRREVVAQFVGARSSAWLERFLDALDPPAEIAALLAAGDEVSLRRALELDRRNADAAVALARLLHAGGETAGALEVLVPVGGTPRADQLAARIRLAGVDDAALSAGLAALDAGRTREGLELLLDARGRGDDIRRLAVAVLDELGFGHPLDGEFRARV